MADAIDEYFAALERLKQNCPEILPKGSRITNDSVALEAGRKKGAIKKSRLVFSGLIEAIDEAAEAYAVADNDIAKRLIEAKSEASRYRALWEEALAREVCLAKQLWEERENWAKEREKLRSDRVTKIHKG